MLQQIDLSRVDINLLVLFEAVLDERHVGRAATRLSLSASAVSHGLGRLRRLLNDPLFLKTPKGVVPSARAVELTEPILDILARVRSVVATAVPFDPATSARRFTIAAPDGVSAVILPPLLAMLRTQAPLVDISVRQLLPTVTSQVFDRAWGAALADLEARSADVAILPVDAVPARFQAQTLYEEQFVVACRAGHPYARSPSLQRFCQMQHLLVSLTGDPFGFVDAMLAERNLRRRIMLTVPNFAMALSVIAESDLLAALPRRLVERHGRGLNLVSTELPVPPRTDKIRAVASRAALMDAGIAWLFERLQDALGSGVTARAKPGARRAKRR